MLVGGSLKPGKVVLDFGRRLQFLISWTISEGVITVCQLASPRASDCLEYNVEARVSSMTWPPKSHVVISTISMVHRSTIHSTEGTIQGGKYQKARITGAMKSL